MGDDRWVYFEYERSAKSVSVTQRKIRHYLKDPSIAQVVYFVPPKTEVATQIKSAVKGILPELDDPRRLMVIEWIPIDPSAQEPKIRAPRSRHKQYKPGP